MNSRQPVALIILAIAQACASVGQIRTIELSPPTTAQLSEADELRARFTYRIPNYDPGTDYFALMVFERGSSQQTISAPSSQGRQTLHAVAGEVQLSVPASVLLNPFLQLSRPLKMWLYINRTNAAHRSTPVLMAGPFTFRIAAEPGKSPPN